MQKIGNITTTADANGEWTNGNVAAGTAPTIIDAAWLNTIQREIANVVTNAGLTLDPANDAQLLAALKLGLGPGRLLGIQIFTAAGTYTPTPGTNEIIVEAVGGGASGSNCATTSGTTFGSAGGGASGSYVKARFTSGFGSVAVTIGSGGTAPAAGANAGLAGGNTTFGSLITAPGGTAAIAGVIGTNTNIVTGSFNSTIATVSGGEVLANVQGEGGGYGVSLSITAVAGGKGGSNPLGTGGWSGVSGGSRAATGYGSGSSGAASTVNTTATTGQPGMPGIVIVWEYA